MPVGIPEAMLALMHGKIDAPRSTARPSRAPGCGTFDPSKYRKVWTSDPIPNDRSTMSDKADPAFRDAVHKRCCSWLRRRRQGRRIPRRHAARAG